MSGNKKVNEGIINILSKVEGHHGLYDILLCKVCHQTCMRSNFSKHKKTRKHLRAIPPPLPVLPLEQPLELPPVS